MAHVGRKASHWSAHLIPMGMMRVKATISSVAVSTFDSVGQKITGGLTVLYTPVVHVESAEREDKMNNMGKAVVEMTYIKAPWYPGLKNGMIVQITDGAVVTTYQIQSIEDDRMKHRFVRLGLTRAEEAA